MHTTASGSCGRPSARYHVLVLGHRVHFAGVFMKKTSKNRFGTVGGAGILAAALFYASATYGQSLGDVARQERERRKQETHQAAHVYTNEDLTREQILIPEDRERVLAARRNESAPEIQAQAVDLLLLPLPNSSVAFPSPEVAIIPISTELQAPPTIPISKMVKIVAKTTRVVVPAQPKIPALPAPALPIVSAKLELAAPQQAIQHREIKEAATAISVVQAHLPTASRTRAVHVQLATVAASPNRTVQHRQTHEAIALVHFEKTKPNPAPKFPSNNVLPAEPAPHRSVQHRELVGVPSRLAVTPAKAPVVNGNFASQAGPTSPIPLQAARGRQTHEAISLVDFERTKSRTASAVSASNALLAQPASREVVRHQSEKPVLSVTQVQTGVQTLEMVRVEHGDSLWKLAKEHLGSGMRWRELAEMNPEIADPRLIRVGDMLRLPNA